MASILMFVEMTGSSETEVPLLPVRPFTLNFNILQDLGAGAWGSDSSVCVCGFSGSWQQVYF